MGRWNDTSAYPNLPAPDASDLLMISDQAEVAGARQRTVTWGQARAAAVATVGDDDPTDADDETLGYAVGSMWFATVSGGFFVCTDATEAAAVWVDILAAS
jgi:hypothetical protein